MNNFLWEFCVIRSSFVVRNRDKCNGCHANSQIREESRNVELDLRNIKTTLGMEVLRCLTPQMVEKEL